jgi:hypothetical protein
MSSKLKQAGSLLATELLSASLQLVATVSRYNVWLQTGRPGFNPRHRKTTFSSSLCAQTSSEAHPAFYPMDTGGPFPGAKARPGRDADHLSRLVQRLNMSRSYTSSPHSACMMCRGQSYFYFYTFTYNDGICNNFKVDDCKPSVMQNVTKILRKVRSILSCSHTEV